MSSAKKPRHSLNELMKKGAAVPADAKPTAASEVALTVKSVSLTPSAKAVLDRIESEVERETGRKASASAIVRALLRYADAHVDTTKIASLISSESTSGEVVWGRVRSR